MAVSGKAWFRQLKSLKCPCHLSFRYLRNLHIKKKVVKKRTSPSSRNDPFGSPLDEFLKENAQVREYKSANIKREEFSCMPRAKFQSNLRFVGMTQPGVFYLPRNLVYSG